jgi:hypothetical protein
MLLLGVDKRADMWSDLTSRDRFLERGSASALEKLSPRSSHRVGLPARDPYICAYAQDREPPLAHKQGSEAQFAIN